MGLVGVLDLLDDALSGLSHVHLDDVATRSLDGFDSITRAGLVPHCSNHSVALLEGMKTQDEPEAI